MNGGNAQMAKGWLQFHHSPALPRAWSIDQAHAARKAIEQREALSQAEGISAIATPESTDTMKNQEHIAFLGEVQS